MTSRAVERSFWSRRVSPRLNVRQGWATLQVSSVLDHEVLVIS